MEYLVNSRFVEGLLDDAVRRQYIGDVPSKWRSKTPFGFNMLVKTISEAYMAAGYQLEEVRKASRPMADATCAVVSRPLPVSIPPASTPTMSPSNPMPTPQINAERAPSAGPMPSSTPEPMKLGCIAKLREELYAYIGERRGDRANCHDNQETRHCYKCGEQGHLALDCQKNQPSSRGNLGSRIQVRHAWKRAQSR